jgi:hypothetical protein
MLSEMRTGLAARMGCLIAASKTMRLFLRTRIVCGSPLDGVTRLVLPRFSSGLFRAMFAMKEIKNGNEIHRRVSA